MLLSCSALGVTTRRKYPLCPAPPFLLGSPDNFFCRVIHALQSNRADLRILGGTLESPNLHRLNGHVITPLFQHLGASSWHSFDAHFIVSMGKLAVPLAMFGISCGCVLVCIWAGLLQYRLSRARRASTSAKSFVRLE